MRGAGGSQRERIEAHVAEALSSFAADPRQGELPLRDLLFNQSGRACA